MLTASDKNASPFHPGEHEAQERMGIRDIEHWARRVVRDHLPDEHRAFHTALPFVVAAARDASGRPWATILAGRKGFIDSPDPRTLVLNAAPAPGDALANALGPGADLGLLGIEFETRRRNRVNGRIAGRSAVRIDVAVDQSFGNCPQYIRERGWSYADPDPDVQGMVGSELTPGQEAWIVAADTLFIASGYRGDGAHPAFGMDASHRGGERGFVQVLARDRLEFPDFAGNNHLNTIGNLIKDPRAGLLFVDFATGSLLQMTGNAVVSWDRDETARYPGAERVVSLQIDEVVELRRALPLRWQAEAESVRSLRLVEKITESHDVTSFVFEARDGGLLPSFEAGQHLPIELRVPGIEVPVRRTYSLSGPPSDTRYRISVKREPRGTASRCLHDLVEPGTILESRRPAGDFVLANDSRPVALISAGIGMTPLVSMLHVLASEPGGRPVWFVHDARDGRHHPLAGEIRELAARRSGITLHTAFSRPRREDRLGRDFDTKGRIDHALLANLINGDDITCYVCGPIAFMSAIHTALEQLGVPAERMHAESFGPMGARA